jgi:exosome complex component RRP45
MPREAELSVNERAFVLQALGERIRIDGRKFDEFRELDLKFGDDHGVAHVTLGKTKCVSPDSYWITALTYPPRVIVRISAEVNKPFVDRPFDGVFTITTELSPIASPAFEVGR